MIVDVDNARIAEAARRLVDDGMSPGVTPPGASRLALAWALKEQCFAAWSSEPQRVGRAAAALRALQVEMPERPMTAAERQEVEALAEWTDGIACITRGQMAEAVRAFDLAGARFRALAQPAHAAETQGP